MANQTLSEPIQKELFKIRVSTWSCSVLTLILRTRPVHLTMLGKRKSLVGTHEAHEIQAVVVLLGHNNLMQRDVWDLTWCHQVDL